jgi:hypothetical protein
MKSKTHRQRARATGAGPGVAQLAELYDKAVGHIERLVRALRLCTPTTQVALDARSQALDAVMEELEP